jgi:hypothetical protein
VPKGVLIVESRPGSPEQAAAFHQRYDQTHLPEMAAIEGVVSARRFAPLDEDGPFGGERGGVHRAADLQRVGPGGQGGDPALRDR